MYALGGLLGLLCLYATLRWLEEGRGALAGGLRGECGSRALRALLLCPCARRDRCGGAGSEPAAAAGNVGGVAPAGAAPLCAVAGDLLAAGYRPAGAALACAVGHYSRGVVGGAGGAGGVRDRADAGGPALAVARGDHDDGGGRALACARAETHGGAAGLCLHSVCPVDSDHAVGDAALPCALPVPCGGCLPGGDWGGAGGDRAAGALGRRARAAGAGRGLRLEPARLLDGPCLPRRRSPRGRGGAGRRLAPRRCDPGERRVDLPAAGGLLAARRDSEHGHPATAGRRHTPAGCGR